MLKKLFSHDMRALSRYMVPIICALLGIAVVACVCLSIFWANNEFIMNPYNPFMGLFSVSFAFVYVFLFLTIAVGFFAFYIVYILRVRSHMFGDEGYLTMAVPATAHEHTLSKLFSGAVWYYISAITEIVVLIVAFVVPILFTPGMFDGTTPPPDTATEAISALGVLNIVLTILLYAVIMPFTQVMILQATVTIGSLMGKKSHIAISVLVYIGINLTSSLLQSILTDCILIGGRGDPDLLGVLYTGILWLIQIGLFVSLYFINTRLLTRHVNLE